LIEKLLYQAPYKIIMSGNPVPKGGHEIFGQYLFMDKGIYGDNFYKFRDKFFDLDYFRGISGMKGQKKEEFDKLFHSGCFVVRKDECLDLPPKVYERRHYQMSPEQSKAYKEMHKDAVTAFDDLSCSADVVITKYLRLSQIAGGYLPLEDLDGKLKELRRFKEQPGLDLMVVDLLSLPSDEQVVIWARFKEEIEMISERLTKEGIGNVCFYGPVKVKDRIEARRQFREQEVRAFISSSAGARGLNDLIGATYVFYYSNDYSADNRQQSEDRNHRSGTEGDKVTYVDYIANCQGYKHQIDEEVLTVLQSNKDYSTALLEQRKAKKV
jgi:SNF2 family DNA or RNA helicase